MDETPRQSLDQTVTTLQIIIGALTAGPLVMAAAFLLVVPGEPQEGVLTKLGLVFGLLCLAVHHPVARRLRSQAHAPAQRLGVYTTSTIVSAAVLEGGCFFNLIAYLIERDNWSLAMAGLLWAALLIKMPTRRGVEGWLEREDRRQRDAAPRS